MTATLPNDDRTLQRRWNALRAVDAFDLTVGVFADLKASGAPVEAFAEALTDVTSGTIAPSAGRWRVWEAVLKH
jgi:hypothetical protein